jgi:hypothetical protein
MEHNKKLKKLEFEKELRELKFHTTTSSRAGRHHGKAGDAIAYRERSECVCVRECV